MDENKVICLTVLFLSACLANKTAEEKVDICFVRYEYTNDLHALWNYTTCDNVYRDRAVCNQTMDVLYNEFPPYIYTDPATKQVVGLLPGKTTSARNLVHCALRSSFKLVSKLIFS